MKHEQLEKIIEYHLKILELPTKFDQKRYSEAHRWLSEYHGPKYSSYIRRLEKIHVDRKRKAK